MSEFGDSRQLGGSVQMVGKGNEWQSLWPNRVGALPGIDQKASRQAREGCGKSFGSVALLGRRWHNDPQVEFIVCAEERKDSPKELRTEVPGSFRPGQ